MRVLITTTICTLTLTISCIYSTRFDPCMCPESVSSYYRDLMIARSRTAGNRGCNGDRQLVAILVVACKRDCNTNGGLGRRNPNLFEAKEGTERRLEDYRYICAGSEPPLLAPHYPVHTAMGRNHRSRRHNIQVYHAPLPVL